MKKTISALSMIALFSLPIHSFAQEKEMVSDKKVPEIVYDVERKALKTFSPALLNPNNKAKSSGAHYVAYSDFTQTGGASSVSDAYTNNKKTKKKTINYIYAKTKGYVNGIYKDSATDTQYNSSHAGAKVFISNNFWDDGEAYGTHEFRLDGYQTWNTETYGT
ncbi:MULTISPECIES: hypothetical protein [Bacillus cereus group]|uniref:XoxI protein n=1 Tax=Bacillus cereus TaxID=1396 RepID=A0A2A8ZW35_BACCE|nr:MULTISPECIES: hypothetical protein [Bacillus cereus group]MCU5459916.1 hypothetical protein [Bacillus cereus]PFE11892.1 hypothetical protein CN307_20545 [Bacillus cereus]